MKPFCVAQGSKHWTLCDRREVKEGVSQTLYPMDPDSELRNLMRTWAEFKRDFEVLPDPFRPPSGTPDHQHPLGCAVVTKVLAKY